MLWHSVLYNVMFYDCEIQMSYWGIMQCSALKVEWHYLHLQGPTSFYASFLFGFFLLWRWRQFVPLKCWLTFIRLHSIMSQKTVFFITTTVQTSNPTLRCCISLTYWNVAAYLAVVIMQHCFVSGTGLSENGDIHLNPKMVKSLATNYVIQITCGQNHSLALTQSECHEFIAWK